MRMIEIHFFFQSFLRRQSDENYFVLHFCSSMRVGADNAAHRRFLFATVV